MFWNTYPWLVLIIMACILLLFYSKTQNVACLSPNVLQWVELDSNRSWGWLNPVDHIRPQKFQLFHIIWYLKAWLSRSTMNKYFMLIANSLFFLNFFSKIINHSIIYLHAQSLSIDGVLGVSLVPRRGIEGLNLLDLINLQLLMVLI